MARNLICPHCGAEVEPGYMDCPYCHQSMFLSMNQIKARADANHIITQDEYVAELQQQQYQQQLSQSYNPQMQQQMYQQPMNQQPMTQQQMYQPMPPQTMYDPNTGEVVQGYYDQYSGQWIPMQQPMMSNQPEITNKNEQSKAVLYIALILDLIGFFIGFGIILNIIALMLASSYKGSSALKTIIQVYGYLYLIAFVLFLIFGLMSVI